MKRLLVLGFLVMAVSAVACIAMADDVYWDFSVPDDTITDRDFSRDYGVPLPSQSRGQGEMYDQFQVPDIESRSGEVQEVPEAPVRARIPDTPARVTPSVQPPETSRPSRSITTRQPETIRKPVTTTTPKPAETDPGTVSSGLERPEKTDGTQTTDADLKKAAPSPSSEVSTQRPTTRRMRWGQMDVKPSEPKAQPQSEQPPQAVE